MMSFFSNVIFCRLWAKLPFLGRLWMTSTAAWKRLWQSWVSDIAIVDITYGLYVSHTPAAQSSITGTCKLNSPVTHVSFYFSSNVLYCASFGRQSHIRTTLTKPMVYKISRPGDSSFSVSDSRLLARRSSRAPTHLSCAPAGATIRM